MRDHADRTPPTAIPARVRDALVTDEPHLPVDLVKLLGAAAMALRSYEHGNASPDLAREVADACDAALAALGSR